MHLRNVLAAIGSFALFAVLVSAQSSKLSSADQAFLDMAAKANMTEAHLGQMAETRASAMHIRDFGKTLLKDHTGSYRSLTELASKIGATIPKGIDVHHNRTVEELMHLEGKTFDRRFLREEVLDHERALAAFRHESEDGQNAEVKVYAKTMVPVLEGHLHTAEALAKPERRIG